MNATLDEARQVLKAASLDRTSFQLLIESGRAPNETISFLAQQACEKFIKATRAAVVPADIGWSDVGSWDSLWQIAARDEHGNAPQGDTFVADTRNSYIRGERFQVKRIMVKPGEKLSLQMHHHRAEHWVVVSGTAKVTVEDKEILLAKNQSTYIPLGHAHRLENPGKIDLHLIEVQSGAPIWAKKTSCATTTSMGVKAESENRCRRDGASLPHEPCGLPQCNNHPQLDELSDEQDEQT